MVLLQKELYKAYIGEDPAWKPNAHTVAYRPLTSTTTVYDQSWNNYTLTQTGGSFTTVDGVDCFYNGWSTTGYFNLTSADKIPTWSAARTILLWVYPTSYSSSYSRYFLSYWRSTNAGKMDLTINTEKKCAFSIWGTSKSWAVMNTTGRTLITLRTNGANTYLHLNGLQQASYTETLTTNAISSSYPFRLMRLNTSTSSNYQVRWYLSEVIIEDKNWTATEILNYFNDNKAKYWLS